MPKLAAKPVRANGSGSFEGGVLFMIVLSIDVILFLEGYKCGKVVGGEVRTIPMGT